MLSFSFLFSSSFFFTLWTNNMKAVWALLLALVIAVALAGGASARASRNAQREAFVARLMASLTLKEKVGQMTQVLSRFRLCFISPPEPSGHAVFINIPID